MIEPSWLHRQSGEITRRSLGTLESTLALGRDEGFRARQSSARPSRVSSWSSLECSWSVNEIHSGMNYRNLWRQNAHSMNVIALVVCWLSACASKSPKLATLASAKRRLRYFRACHAAGTLTLEARSISDLLDPRSPVLCGGSLRHTLFKEHFQLSSEGFFLRDNFFRFVTIHIGRLSGRKDCMTVVWRIRACFLHVSSSLLEEATWHVKRGR
jgi:hypothetical protein